MKDRLDTYALWEALREGSECLLCALRRKTERTLIARSLGGAVMSPDDRQRVNAAGFCPAHHQQLYQQNNRLGHALITLSRLQTLLPQVEEAFDQLEPGKAGHGKGLFRRKEAADAPASALHRLSAGCLLCQELEAQSARQAETLVYLWQHDPEFAPAFTASKGLCLPDTARMMDLAGRLPAAAHQAFLSALRQGLTQSLSRLEEELSWYTQKFDYRNQEAPWGQSKDALERTANKLRGWCLGPEPMEENGK